ncbi:MULTISPECIES: DUF445 domain-containing protein [Sporosarcina]|uniref:DUF445 domain-containing protein n=1 Tax=Sporosarcina TaxID=1569 RepID=UPI000590AF57|nr:MULTISPECIES: DUF445 family protein [Sporosarcina]WJY27690.1 DUF445 family protein [Sporosarcina sp. 0.2-SM1T-5]
MDFLWVLLFMALIGALIGGFTNHLAIKMLFRPHEAKYIGKWHIPFTPGLIPKRRDELAVQLGKTVTNYLLTPETFRKRLLTPEMAKKTETFLQGKLEKEILLSDRTLADWLELGGVHGMERKIDQKAGQLIDERFQAVKTAVLSGTVEETVPAKWLEQAEEHIPSLTSYILGRADGFVDSYEGKVMFQRLITDFLESKGTLGGMVKMLFGDSNSLVEKVQREARKFIAAPGTTQLIETMLTNEWTKLKQRPMAELAGGFDWEGLGTSLRNYALDELDAAGRLAQPIRHYWADGAAWTAEHLTPQLVEFAFAQAEVQLEQSLKRLKLDQIVKEQVDTFPVAVLEDLVLGISRREFKMITVLGALLGGIIGIVQGLIVYFTNLT